MLESLVILLVFLSGFIFGSVLIYSLQKRRIEDVYIHSDTKNSILREFCDEQVRLINESTQNQIAYFREGFERGYEADKREPAFLNASQSMTGVETFDDEELYERERPANPTGKEEIEYEERYQGVFDVNDYE